MTDTPGAASKLADLLYDSFYSSAIGGSVVALTFLVFDTVDGQPLFTASLLGSVLFLGASAAEVTDVRLDMVALFTPVHFAAFAALGTTISEIVERVPSLARHPGVTALFLLLALEVGFLAPAVLFFPGLANAIGFGRILLANALTAGAMAVFLRQAHAETEEDVSLGAKGGGALRAGGGGATG